MPDLTEFKTGITLKCQDCDKIFERDNLPLDVPLRQLKKEIALCDECKALKENCPYGNHTRQW